MNPPRKPVRLWPAVAIVVLAGFALTVLWAVPEMQRQQRYLRSAGVLSAAMFGLLLWLLFLSRLPWVVRFGGLAVVVLLGVALGLSFEITGVNGDLLPIIEPRWKPREAMAAPETKAVPVTKTNMVRADFPQFYGPSRNGVIQAVELESDWAGFPPKILWRQPVGASWSGFAVKNGIAITLEQRGESEYVIAYDLLTGTALWTHATPARYATTIAGEGPRTTPTISAERVYTFGGSGVLNCLDFRTGTLLWSKDTPKENDARIPDWGYAGSPLVVDGKVIVSVGGSNGRSLIAYSADDGKIVWADGSGGADYSSPVELNVLGTRQIVIFSGRIESRDLTGRLLWTYPWPGGHPHVTPPLLVSSNQLFISSGYGTGCERIRIDRDAAGKWNATREWKALAMKSKFGPLFHVGNYVYGLDDGIFCGVDLNEGQRKWKDGRYGHGQALLVGSLILLTSEKGDIVLIRPDPEKLVELARFKVFGDKTWNPPALAGEYLIVRNDKEAACLQLKLRTPAGMKTQVRPRKADRS